MNRWEERIEDREEGREEGRTERNFEIARNFKEAGFDFKVIAENTGLTLKEVEEL